MKNSIVHSLWKRGYGWLIAIAIFFLLTLVYASPVLMGKVVQAGDHVSWQGMVHEAMMSKDSGNPTWWTGSMFSGMPSYQIGGGSYLPVDLALPFTKISRFFLGNETLFYLMGYFFCFFLMLKCFRLKTNLAIVGSIAITFSSYFFIIIAAGHNTKVESIALLAPVVGGFFLIFRKRYLWGALLTAVYVMLGVMKHPQIAYYYCMLIGILGCAELYIHIKEKRYKDLGLACLVFLGAFLVGVGAWYPKYKANLEYMSETMRGGHSELVKESDEQNKTEGLNLDYATAWSYGVGETFTLLVPGFMGNASGYDVGTDSEVYKSFVDHGVSRREAAQYAKHMPTYWGDQPFTAGPVYVGAIVCFLFVLGLCIIEGPYKWALLAATVVSVMLSWGHNFMPLTDFFFKYFPMYNRFRAVSSMLVVAEVTMPLLGFLALKRIMDGEMEKKDLLKKMYISAGVTGGLCLLSSLLGGALFDFSSVNDVQNFKNLPDWLVSSIMDERESMLRSDAFRSFLFIAAAFVLLWLYVKDKLKANLFVLLLGVFILLDMWPICKRYFNNDNFVTVKEEKNYFKKLPWEEQLLSSETDMNYRVLNLTTNTFNESRTSYYFKSIGGYHAAKLRRYQDLIEEHISKFNMPVLNMLNTKYVITKGQDGQTIPQRNPDAMGNAWFVDSIVVANTPNEESDALKTINVKNTAVTDVKFSEFVNSNLSHDSSAVVKELTYAPNKLVYESQSERDGTIVFSEVYYPYGWKAYIDGQETPHFRVNYLLRALNVPSGKHSIEFVFDPDSVRNARPIAYICYAILYGLVFFALGGWIYGLVRKRRDSEENGLTNL